MRCPSAAAAPRLTSGSETTWSHFTWRVLARPVSAKRCHLGGFRHVEAMGKKQWIVWVDHHFLCQHFLGIHNPYFQRHGCFFNVGLWVTKTWIVQTTWRWLYVFPTKVRSTNELIMVDPRTYGSYVMLYPPALTLIWMWPPQVSLFITPSTTIDITYILHKP